MDEPSVVGLEPLIPWPLSRWRWLAAPVRAERLAVLRISLIFLLLLDVLTTYLPNATLLFGADSFAAGDTFAYNIKWPKHGWPQSWEKAWEEVQDDWKNPPSKFYWSLLNKVEDHKLIYLAMTAWVVALIGMLFGFCTRINAVVVWVISTSFANINPYVDNAGDTVRGIILFYLMFCPSGATWSVDAWLRGRKRPVFVSPWVLRLVFLQMICIYFCNGLHKIIGSMWRDGDSLYYVLGDLTLARWSYAEIPLPPWLTYFLSSLGNWFVLAWEVTLPLLLIWRPVRNVALVFGALFHIGIWLTMELGMFPLYMLCLYLPLLPWEKAVDWWFAKAPATVNLAQPMSVSQPR